MVAQFLDLALPRDAVWTTVEHGGKRTKAEAGKLKAKGLKRGWPDIQIIYRGRVILFELKAPGSTRSPAQKLMHAQLSVAGALVYTATRIEEVESFLRVIIPLKATTGARAA
ncbi:hypothetical protein LCGC14_2136350 [marine sediment metagenome]|uniref:VRR-NUC domain-containing protein n=1 Tax=marine sediment metagenome TaxID=412755 RepID=A0A0F9GCY2_9ZZZZ